MRSRLKFVFFLALAGVLASLILLPLLSSGGPLNAKTSTKATYSRQDFIKKIAPTAQNLSKSYGIKTSIIIGQAVLDSNYGSNLLASKYHNLYSLQAQEGQPGISLKSSLYIDNQWQEVTQRYRVYDSWEESMADYLAALRQGQVGDSGLYQSMASSSSYRSMAKALQAAEFSTDPEYANELIAVIDQNNLTDYDD